MSSWCFLFSASEVLRDATLTVSYSFNNVSLLDDGPLGINGTGTNVQYVTAGRVGPGLSLSSSPAFFQASGLVYLGTASYPYSVSIWIRPTSIASGTIIQVSSSSAPLTWSMPMLGFTSAGSIGAQACGSNGTVVITGTCFNSRDLDTSGSDLFFIQWTSSMGQWNSVWFSISGLCLVYSQCIGDTDPWLVSKQCCWSLRGWCDCHRPIFWFNG